LDHFFEHLDLGGLYDGFGLLTELVSGELTAVADMGFVILILLGTDVGIRIWVAAYLLAPGADAGAGAAKRGTTGGGGL
jgi:hypothetical protein